MPDHPCIGQAPQGLGEKGPQGSWELTGGLTGQNEAGL